MPTVPKHIVSYRSLTVFPTETIVYLSNTVPHLPKSSLIDSVPYSYRILPLTTLIDILQYSYTYRDLSALSFLLRNRVDDVPVYSTTTFLTTVPQPTITYRSHTVLPTVLITRIPYVFPEIVTYRSPTVPYTSRNWRLPYPSAYRNRHHFSVFPLRLRDRVDDEDALALRGGTCN